MAGVYSISCTEKLQLMEKELASQLSALKTEIEENGVLQGTPSKAYSSVPVPKDISYFRSERELVLKQELQVAAARPVLVQADVMQRELESCLTREYSPESLPLLLHQFYAERSCQLAQCKYQYMLRWRRFCRHSSVIEQLYPQYKKQVGLLMGEYEDSVQRAGRLAVSREKVLTGKGNPMNAVNQEDMVIYLQWLVCHLHSVKTIHHYLRALQYLPVFERMKGGTQRDDVAGDGNGLSDSTSSFSRLSVRPATVLSRHSSSAGKSASGSSLQGGSPFISSIGSPTIGTNAEGLLSRTMDIPKHSMRLEEFDSQLQQLLSHFNIDYNTKDIKNTANELELFRLVSREFRTVFNKQETMKTFPTYDATESAAGHWGKKTPSMALKTEANWIPFIRVKPKRDPWQQKQATKLEQHKFTDELLRLHSKFLQVSDPNRVMESLKEHAANISDPQPIRPISVTSHPEGQNTNQIWMRIYSASNLFQEPNPEESSSAEGDAWDVEKANLTKRLGSSKKNKDGYSYMDTMQLLGLDDGQEENNKDPVMTMGAYLSLLYLRHLRIRDLQRTCLGILNYMRSVERTLTIDTAGLSLHGGELGSLAEESCWMSAARGGTGTPGGLGSRHYLHNTPVDYKVHCSQFMEFPDIENHNDFYTIEEDSIHTQDQRGLYIVYDVALKDLGELEKALLLMASHFIGRDRGLPQSLGTDLHGCAKLDVDRFAVLLDLWTCEATFLKSKQQLIDCYFEAYQHVIDAEERLALAQVITDIAHQRPRLDLSARYFVSSYKQELVCLQGRQQLLRLILNAQIDEQRQYLEKIWRDGQKGTVREYGLPPNYIPKQLVSINNSWQVKDLTRVESLFLQVSHIASQYAMQSKLLLPALKNVFLLELHPSLSLASRVHWALSQAYDELCQQHRPSTVSQRVALEQRLLQQALDKWQTLDSPGASYSSQVQKDLFSDVISEDPFFVRDIGFSVLESADEEEKKQGKERQAFIVDTFSRLLELVTIRHRLMESASETTQLSQLYRMFAGEMGFDEFHLYLRPVQFEFAVPKEKAEPLPPVFITALLQDDSRVDRYTPTSLLLGIQEVDHKQIGRFSFRTEESIAQLMSRSGIENLQVVLTCQVTQKNALIGAVKQASLCYWAQTTVAPQDKELQMGRPGSRTDGGSTSGRDSRVGKDLESKNFPQSLSPSRAGHRPGAGTWTRPAEAFVSLQLEKLGPRDEMLNMFIKKKQAMGTVMQNPEEVEKIKRGLILEYCQKVTLCMSQYSLRGQIVEYYSSLIALLDDIPAIRDTYFMIGKPHERKGERDSERGLLTDPRSFQSRPRCLLSADGKTFLNLWFLPHFSEVLIMFKSLDRKACRQALHQTLRIVAAFHDIVCYLVSFARLGNDSTFYSSRQHTPLVAHWGGTEGIAAELHEIQKQIDSLCDPTSPLEVGRLLHLRRDVMFLQFDAAVRHLIREAFLSAGNTAAYQTVTDKMSHALPVLSDCVTGSLYSTHLTLPLPLQPDSIRAERMYPWRSFLSQYGPFPFAICSIPAIEHSMQMCLSGLDEHSQNVANGEILGVSLLMEDVLQGSHNRIAFSLQSWEGDKTSQPADKERIVNGDEEPGRGEAGPAAQESWVGPLQEPVEMYTVLQSFLVLWKQLERLKEVWGRQRLGVQQINTLSLYKQFSRMYSVEILYPVMRAIARQLGKEEEYEVLQTDTQPILPPSGASEVDIKTRQLHKLLESLESEMISEVQKKITKELTMVISERARQDTRLPTELWKHPGMKQSFAPERPEIVENFVQQLMWNCEETPDEKVTFSKAHLHSCVTALACAVMQRERSNFDTYSMFYENILQQETQLLYQREQDLKALEESRTQRDGPDAQVADLSQEIIVEITALRSHLAQLEEERGGVQEQVCARLQQEYEALVRSLFNACFSSKAKLDEYRVRMEQDVSQLVSQVRSEGVENMMKLKKKFGSTKDDEALLATLSAQEKLQELRWENNQLDALLCKLKALGFWKHSVTQGKLGHQLRSQKQAAERQQKESLVQRMVAEEEGVLLRQQLEAARTALSQCQAEYKNTKRQLEKQRQLLKEVEHRSAQEARSRQHLDSMRSASLEQLQMDAEHRELQLRSLTDQLERSARVSQLQHLRTDKEIRQVRSQLSQERSLKLDAFQRVDELQSLVYDTEASLSQRSSPTGQNKKSTSLLSRSTSSIKSTVPGSAKCNKLAIHSASALPREPVQESPTVQGNSPDPRLQRPKTGPSRLRSQAVDALLPDLEEGGPHSLLTKLQELRLGQK
ncbi:coiled-coil domain containing 162 [Amia ocellicauda]|uniref:coiled-coil domain containing 162 n=1 Tax=Amia ocellicauda TaxID=2972642 RepID=UPI003464064E